MDNPTARGTNRLLSQNKPWSWGRLGRCSCLLAQGEVPLLWHVDRFPQAAWEPRVVEWLEAMRPGRAGSAEMETPARKPFLSTCERRAHLRYRQTFLQSRDDGTWQLLRSKDNNIIWLPHSLGKEITRIIAIFKSWGGGEQPERGRRGRCVWPPFLITSDHNIKCYTVGLQHVMSIHLYYCIMSKSFKKQAVERIKSVISIFNFL